MQALIILDCNSLFDTWRYFGFGWTTIGEHHVSGSSAGTCSNIHTGRAITSVCFCIWYRPRSLSYWYGVFFYTELHIELFFILMSLTLPIPSNMLLSLLVVASIS